LRVVCSYHVVAGTDDLALALHFDQERGAGGALPLRRLFRALCLPLDLAGSLLQSDDTLDFIVVEVEDKQVIHEDGGAAIAVLRCMMEIGVTPKDFAIQIKTSRS